MWPIILTSRQSEAVILAAKDFLKSLEDVEARGVVAILVNQMERGLALDIEEQELLRSILILQVKEDQRELQDAFFKLYGVWPIRPAWWELDLRRKGWRG